MGTDGRHGETPEDLAEGESLQDRRKAETERSAEVLGVKKVHWLGYHDSGMTGWPQNKEPNSFIGADVETAALALAKILHDEQAAWWLWSPRSHSSASRRSSCGRYRNRQRTKHSRA